MYVRLVSLCYMYSILLCYLVYLLLVTDSYDVTTFVTCVYYYYFISYYYVILYYVCYYVAVFICYCIMYRYTMISVYVPHLY